jgi:hypothetical protein
MNVEIGAKATQLPLLGIFVSNFQYYFFAVHRIKVFGWKGGLVEIQ